MDELTTGELRALLTINGKQLSYYTLEGLIGHFELVSRTLPSGMRLFDKAKALAVKEKLPATLARGQSLLANLKN